MKLKCQKSLKMKNTNVSRVRFILTNKINKNQVMILSKMDNNKVKLIQNFMLLFLIKTAHMYLSNTILHLKDKNNIILKVFHHQVLVVHIIHHILILMVTTNLGITAYKSFKNK